MGDISELRGIVTIGSFLAILVLLISWVPSAFLIPNYEGRTIQAPDYFEAIELEKYAITWNYTLDGTDAVLFDEWYRYRKDDIGGQDIAIFYVQANSSDTDMFQIYHIEYWWIFETGKHLMEIWNDDKSRGDMLSKAEINQDYANDDLSYTFSCEHFQFDLFFGFDVDTYSDPVDALDHNDLRIMIGVEWDQVSTSLSAWDIIGMLLFFQLPNVHWMVNALIAIPIWLAVAYLSFILILRAIGAIFGGGGA